jgi:hypothetical protein
MDRHHQDPRATPGPGYRWLGAVGALSALLLIGGGLAWRALSSAPAGPTGGPALAAPDPAPAVARRETRPTLDPARFVGKARAAHQVAREIPDVLDRLYCYCECDKHMGHRSLLSCYTDGHAAT